MDTAIGLNIPHLSCYALTVEPKTALDKLPKGMDSVKKASDQFKSLKSYTKWFNTVPLLGVGAIGANKYFTNNESRN